MNRRKFLQLASIGTMSLLLGGCSASEKSEARIQSNNSEPNATQSTGGSHMKIVVVNSSPHSESESTSRFLSQRFVAGDRFYARTYDLNHKKSMLMVTAYNSADWTMEAIVAHYETLVRYMNWNDVGQVLAIGCGSRRLVERSDFGNQAYNIGAHL